MEKQLIKALEEGKTVTLNDLGGLRSLEENSITIANSPLMSEFLSIVLNEFHKLNETEIDLAEKLILFCFEKVTDGLVIQEAIYYLDSYRPFSKNFEDKCFKITLQEAQNLQKAPMTRAMSLECAFRFALDNSGRRYKLLSYLVDLPIEDDPEYLRHVAKIVGLAHTFWDNNDPENELYHILEKLASIESGSDEAYFELGLASLACALDAESHDIAKDKFKQAWLLFQKSMDKREDRPDAEAYHATISMLLSFENNDIQKNYSHNLARLNKALSIYHAWHEYDTGSVWISARQTEMANWYMLATKLESLSGSLAEPSWIEPILVIEQALLKVYTASRTIFKRNKLGGLEKIIQPKIEASLINNQGQLYVLEKWLELQPPEELGSFGQEIMKVINLTKAEISLGKEYGAVSKPELTTAPYELIISNSSDSIKSSISQVFEDYLSLQNNDISPVLERILKNCISTLENIEDYKNQRVKQSFNVLLFLTLRFLENRMDMTKKNNPRLKYLFEPEVAEKLPKEEELQNDYFQFMHGNISAGNTKVEVSDIASGRADVYFSFGSIQFVAEVKRDDKDCSFNALRTKYIGQASEYQNTNVKLGFLLVLDLTEKAHGSGSIEDNFKVETIISPNSSIERAVVVVRVPGRRKTPSQI